ncbi:MAG: class I SAM-dependent methyltransferase [Methylacidiphilales bacterium]|nr:class I SAM-dependent methyltransferase [Candidatus Methylacidiphilales bacterium]
MDLIESQQLGPEQACSHWYYRSKFKLLEKSLASVLRNHPSPKLADFGCGDGIFLKLIERSGLMSAEQMTGIDSGYARAQQSGEIRMLPEFPPGGKFDVILMMDVLEHVEDEQAVLAEVLKHLNSGGTLFITVPALPILWSRHDEILLHYRRYTLSSLKSLLSAFQELKIFRLHYYYGLLLPVAAPLRFFKRHSTETQTDLQPAPALLNLLLVALFELELHVARWNRLAGLSAVAVCRLEK